MSNYPHITKDSINQVIHIVNEDGITTNTYYPSGNLKESTWDWGHLRCCTYNDDKYNRINSEHYEDGLIIYYNHVDGSWCDNRNNPLELTLYDIADQFGVTVESIKIIA